MTKSFGCTRVLAVLFVTVVACGTTMRPATAFAACGDGSIDAGEQCDDGNLQNGDCCSDACQYETFESPCADDGEFCTRDVCDGAGTCVHDGSPLDSCLIAPKGKLTIVNDADDAKDKLILQMQHAPGLSPADLGDPTTTDAYHACIFGPDGLLMHAEVGPGGTCDGKPCWVETKTGFMYKDKTGARDGITGVNLKASAKPKTKVSARGQGAALDDAPLPFPDKVMAQIVNAQNGRCFETYFLEPSAVKKNSAAQYDAKSAFPGFELPGLATSPRRGHPVVVRQDDLDPGTPSPSFAPERAAPPSGPDPTKVYVQSIAFEGTGCPAGSVGESFTPGPHRLHADLRPVRGLEGPGRPGERGHQDLPDDPRPQDPAGLAVQHRDHRLPRLREPAEEDEGRAAGDLLLRRR